MFTEGFAVKTPRLPISHPIGGCRYIGKAWGGLFISVKGVWRCLVKDKPTMSHVSHFITNAELGDTGGSWLIIMRYCLLFGLTIATAIAPLKVKADNVSKIVISGYADSPTTVSLGDYNRITFFDDHLSLSSSTDNTVTAIDLLYSLYYHIEFHDGEPVNVPEITATTEILSYDASIKCLHLKTEENPKQFSIGIFSANGTLIFAGKFNESSTISLADIPTGIYVAIATNGKTDSTIKFIIK